MALVTQTRTALSEQAGSAPAIARTPFFLVQSLLFTQQCRHQGVGGKREPEEFYSRRKRRQKA